MRDLILEVLQTHVGTATDFCKACRIHPTRDENDELPDDDEWIRQHQAHMIEEAMETEYGIRLLPPHMNAGEAFWMPTQEIARAVMEGNSEIVVRKTGPWEVPLTRGAWRVTRYE